MLAGFIHQQIFSFKHPNMTILGFIGLRSGNIKQTWTDHQSPNSTSIGDIWDELKTLHIPTTATIIIQDQHKPWADKITEKGFSKLILDQQPSPHCLTMSALKIK